MDSGSYKIDSQKIESNLRCQKSIRKRLKLNVIDEKIKSERFTNYSLMHKSDSQGPKIDFQILKLILRDPK